MSRILRGVRGNLHDCFRTYRSPNAEGPSRRRIAKASQKLLRVEAGRRKLQLPPHAKGKGIYSAAVFILIYCFGCRGRKPKDVSSDEEGGDKIDEGSSSEDEPLAKKKAKSGEPPTVSTCMIVAEALGKIAFCRTRKSKRSSRVC